MSTRLLHLDLRWLLVTSIILTHGMCFAASPMIPPSRESTETLGQQLTAISRKLDQKKDWLSSELWIPVIGTLAAAFGGWAIAFQTLKRTLEEQRITRDEQLKMQLREQVANSLKWFEGGSQKRSIGIADIETHIRDAQFMAFYTTWAKVLVNQAIYLLTESDQSQSLHETDNLERILNLLPYLPVTSYSPVR